jgi:putative oxidoreductase
MFWKDFEKHRDVGLLVLRLGFGLGFIFFHGWGKLVGGPERWAGVGGAMDSIGIGFGHTFFGFMAALSESIGGLLFAAGLFFRPVSALLCFTMLVASANHIVTDRGSPAHSLKNAAVFLGVIFIGPGKYSLDYLIERKLKRTTSES